MGLELRTPGPGLEEGKPCQKSDLKMPSSAQSPRRGWEGKESTPKHARTLPCPQVTCSYLCSFLQSVPGDPALAANLSGERGNFTFSPGATREKIPGSSPFKPGEGARHGGGWGALTGPSAPPPPPRSPSTRRLPAPSGGGGGVGGARRSGPAWAVHSQSRHIKEHRFRRRTAVYFPRGKCGGLHYLCPSPLPLPPPHSQPTGRILL